MTTLRLQRRWRSLYATYGTLNGVPGDGLYIVTLEPPKPIPAGLYRLVPYLSPRFGYVVWLIADDPATAANEGVPGHSFVEIHRGNYAADTKLCTLVGTAEAEGWDPHTGETQRIITGSRDAFNDLMRRTAGLKTMTYDVRDESRDEPEWTG